MEIRLCKIKCITCSDILEETDIIVLDFFNTISHRSCYQGEINEIKGIGSYKELAEKFPYFYDDDFFS